MNYSKKLELMILQQPIISLIRSSFFFNKKKSSMIVAVIRFQLTFRFKD